ncbi:hypothetical protein POW01_18105 [Enterobacter cloacae]|uniref:hypothetical protein n=1 Tax=Enterobacter cloacae TaxID=550 RepID=UPI002FF7556A
MSTITREQLRERAREKVKSLEFAVTQTAFADSRAELEEELELARIALASLEAEPVSVIKIDHESSLIKHVKKVVSETNAPTAPVVPAELHPDTQELVTDFCTALAEKLYKAQLKYGYDADWKQDGWPTQCQAHFHQHIAKGDPRDVAAYCAFMWYHGWKTESEPAPVSVPNFDTLRLLFEASERQSDHGFNLHKYGIGFADEATQARWEAWVACRAAMLQRGKS